MRQQVKRRINLIQPGFFAVLVTTAACLTGPAYSQTANCIVQNNSYVCTTSGNSPSNNGFYGFQNGNPDTLPMIVTSNGTVSYGVANGAGVGLNFGSTAGSGGNTNGLQLTNAGRINLTTATSQANFSIEGIQVQQTAGIASSGNGGSSLSGVTVTNENNITISLPGLQAGDYVGGIWAADSGGAGTNQYAGGMSAGVTILNSGAVSLSATGAVGASGIQALSFGGIAGSDGGAGGTGGAASVTSSAAVNVNWTWSDTGNSNLGLYGIQAFSSGEAGSAGSDSGGGNGGASGSAAITLNLGGNVSVVENGAPPKGTPPAPSAGVTAASIGGSGGEAAYGDNNDGGTGGAAQGNAQVSVTDANITTAGNQLPAILAYLSGGAGGAGGPPASDAGGGGSDGWQDGGNGGDVNGSASVSVATSTIPVTISTAGANSPAVAAELLAGAGGLGGSQARLAANGGTGGAGGNVNGGITVSLTGSPSDPLTLTTNGTNSPGVYALSAGGNGGNSGEANGDSLGSATSYPAGDAGSGGNVTVSLAATSISTQANSSPGIVAVSEGGLGGSSGNSWTGPNKSTTGNAGNGGNTGTVTVTLDAASSIATQGADSIGVFAQTSGGGGGYAGSYNGVASSGGIGGSGGNGGNVSVTSAATISTQGQTARGILAQSVAGAGGAGSSGWSFGGDGGNGAQGGIVGAVSVTNSGSISTNGTAAEGVLEQSIGGAGGAGGSASGFVTVGGSASDNPFTSDGNTVSFISDGGSITTGGTFGIGVLAQSIGGGGGDGGGASGGKVAIGGNGGQGGAGGQVTTQLSNGSITTNGNIAPAVVMQSIGGGGGSGGNATSAGLTATVSLGGAGGEGGVGGGVTFNSNNATITTVGTLSPGLIVQSIGGGGGNGGNAFGGSVGPGFASTTTIGGSGGSGSYGNVAQAAVTGGLIATGQNPYLVEGGTINIANGTCTAQSGASFVCTQMPVDDFGAVVQSIGGGGGKGGSAIAQSVAIAIPISPSGTQVGVAASVALGGTGGSGGQGNEADFALSNGGTIKTMGQGSTAVVVQSIGGGGGNGGATSAASTVLGYGGDSVPEGAYQVGVQVNVTEGGTGGSGGTGGPVNVAIGGSITNTSNYITPGAKSSDNGTINTNYTPATITQDQPGSAPTTIITYNDYADGVLAQSIGGGGGNAGVGSGNTQDFGTKTTAGLNLSLGSNGGSGGAAGTVTVDLFPGNGITTYGSGSVGIIAQSIGGGGGTSQGSSIDPVAGTDINGTTYKPGMKINLGTGTWGSHSEPTSGGTGGAVTVNVFAPITTHGGDATGVLVQSIGGGGGMAGGSGADASADNPIVAALNSQENAINNVHTLADNSSTTIDPTLAVSIGGTGGSGNTGGAATANIYSAISTSGDWANGVVVQSIGGGGGKGGTAIATGSGGSPEVTINLDYALGGTGGSGGDGGPAAITLGSGASIATSGFAAAAVVAQSIGGGGGIGADGSDSATGDISVGNVADGNKGAGGNGGTVCVNCSNTTTTTISTTGAAADGVILQSVGGGGGIGGTGNRVWGNGLWTPETGKLALAAGGGTNAVGDGGPVTFGLSTATGPLTISTTGYDAYGLLAQSIGGGGGIISVNPVATSVTYALGTYGSGNGGNVSVTLPSGGSGITTTGIAAHGVVAQSIGGGGGIMRDVQWYTDTPALTASVAGWTSAGNSLSTHSGSGNGGNVTVVTWTPINVSGPGSIGIVAQSVGGGGGLLAQGNQIFAGTVSTGGSDAGGTVTVNVEPNSPISASGQNGIGIFAQSTGSPNDKSTGQVNVTVSSAVSGGSGTAGTPTQPGSSGVQIDSSAGNNNGNGNQVTVNSGGAITTQLTENGTAILQTGGGFTNVTNEGTVTGSVYLNGGTINNNDIGTYNPGPEMQGNLVNAGTVNLGLPGSGVPMTTHVTGNFVQTGTGKLNVIVDSLNKAFSQLHVDGTANVGGTFVPTAVSLLPGALPVVTAGSLSGTADAPDSMLFNWDVAPSGNTLNLTPSSNFTPSNLSLTASEVSLGTYFNRAWNNADAAFATRFASLSQLNDPGQYKTMLDAYSGKATEAQSMALINSAGKLLGSAMSCPVFADRSVLLGEGNCAWAKVTGQISSQWVAEDTQGYHVSGATYRLGAQHEIAPNWYLGGSFAVGQTWATTDGTASGNSSGYGQTYDGSVALKYTTGPWLFAGSVALAGGSFHSNRLISIPGVNLSLQSDPSAFLAGGRLRAGYEIPFNNWYIRPYGDFDVIYTNLPGFRESGPALYALDVHGSSKTSVALSPMVEFGGRLALDDKTVLRPFAAVGVSILPNNTRSIEASFVGAEPEDGTFRSFLNAPNVLGNIELGAQLYRTGGFEVKAEYDASIGGSFLSQSASARLAYHF